MSRPSNSTLPEVAMRSPVRQLKKVDLPAPLGPIRPRISPCSSVMLAASTALNLPNALVMLRASRSMVCPGCEYLFLVRRSGAPLQLPRDQREDTARMKARNQNDDRTINHKGQSRAGAAEQTVGDFLERHQDCGANEPPEQKPRAAECRHDQHLNRDQDAEAGFRIDKAEHGGVKRTGDAGQTRAEHEGIEFDAV